MNKHHGSSLDSLFDELGEREEVLALAAKKILAVQAEKRMKELGLTVSSLASRMGTSRSQVMRVLDRDDAGVTLKMLIRAAQALEMPLQISFVSSARPAASKGVSRSRARAASPAPKPGQRTRERKKARTAIAAS